MSDVPEEPQAPTPEEERPAPDPEDRKDKFMRPTVEGMEVDGQPVVPMTSEWLRQHRAAAGKDE